MNDASGNSAHCPAKINLFLEVRDKRSDGFHNLGTLFQSLECGDTLTARPSDAITLDCSETVTPNMEDNLVVKAARLLKATYADRIPADSGIHFDLEKILPLGAGLGGGSSNAASALLLANGIWNLGLTREDLLPLAARLGSDVPFFLWGGSYFGEGKGEILKPAPSPMPFHVLIATPHCHVNTGWAYGELRHSAPPKKFAWEKFKALYFTFFEDEGFYGTLQNDFEKPIRANFPEIERLFAEIAAFHPVKSMLCGSGASVFALFKASEPAEKCLEAVRGLSRFSCLTRFAE